MPFFWQKYIEARRPDRAHEQENHQEECQYVLGDFSAISHLNAHIASIFFGGSFLQSLTHIANDQPSLTLELSCNESVSDLHVDDCRKFRMLEQFVEASRSTSSRRLSMHALIPTAMIQ